MKMMELEGKSTYQRRGSLRLRGFDYSTSRIYFVTIVVTERRRVFLDKRIAQAMIESLVQLRRQMAFILYCYCLMPDHIHLLIGLGESGRTLGEVCGAFKSLSTREYWRWHQGKLWQRQFFDHVIRDEEEFLETMQNIRLNPVRKELVERAEEWPYTGSVDEFE